MTTPPLNRPVGYHSKEFWDRFAEEKCREQTRSIRETEVTFNGAPPRMSYRELDARAAEARVELVRREAARLDLAARTLQAKKDRDLYAERLRDIAAMAKDLAEPKLELQARAALHALNAPLLVPPKNRDVYMGDLE